MSFATMRDWYSQHAAWQGTAAELADVVRDLLDRLGLADASVIPNERLVRHYAQQGILEKPVRRGGKEAYFGPRQVIEFLVARKLLAEGWPLAKIAEFNPTQGLESLLDQLPRPRVPNPAEQLVANFRQAMAPDRPGPSANAAAPGSFHSHSAEQARRRSSTRDQLMALGNPAGEPQRTVMVRLTLTPWCELWIEPEGLKAIPPEALDTLGEAIAHVLREEMLIQKRKSL